MAVTLNVNTDSKINQTLVYPLEGSKWYLNIYYNYRSGWYVSISDSDDNLIRSGIKLMPSASVFKGMGIFEGAILCADTDPVYREDGLTRDNFGDNKRYKLVYYSSEELESLAT